MIIIDIGCKLVIPLGLSSRYTRAHGSVYSYTPDNVANETAYVLISNGDIQ